MVPGLGIRWATEQYPRLTVRLPLDTSKPWSLAARVSMVMAYIPFGI